MIRHQLLQMDHNYMILNIYNPQKHNFPQQIKQKQILKESGLLIHEAPGEESSDFIGWKLLRTIGKSKKGSPIFRIFQLDNQHSQS